MIVRRVHVVIATMLAVTAAVGGCSADEPADDGSGCGDPPTCYPADVARDWCYVEQVRDGVTAGRLSAEDLPSWVDLSKREDGRPQVYDFTTTDPNEWAGWSDDLRNAIRRAGKTWDADAVNACSDRNEVEDVIRSEGVPRT